MDLSSAVFDPALGCAAFTVERITYTRSREGMTSQNRTDQALGCVHPGTPEMLRLLPEEEKAVYTDYPLSTGTHEADGAFSFTGPDRIRWNGQTWRVVRVRDWQAFGYCQALAVLMNDEGSV